MKKFLPILIIFLLFAGTVSSRNNCYSVIPITLPSNTSMLCSIYPHNILLHHNGEVKAKSLRSILGISRSITALEGKIRKRKGIHKDILRSLGYV